MQLLVLVPGGMLINHWPIRCCERKGFFPTASERQESKRAEPHDAPGIPLCRKYAAVTSAGSAGGLDYRRGAK